MNILNNNLNIGYRKTHLYGLQSLLLPKEKYRTLNLKNMAA